MTAQFSKHASVKIALNIREVGGMVAPALIPAAVGLGVGAMASGAGWLKNQVQRVRTYKDMLELNPSLKKRDPDSVKRVFNSLHRINPAFMGDPMVAGAIVHNTLEQQESYGGAGQPMVALAKQVSELAQGRASMSTAMKNERTEGMKPLVEGLSQGLGGAMKHYQDHSSFMKGLKGEREDHQTKFLEAKQQGERDIGEMNQRLQGVQGSLRDAIGQKRRWDEEQHQRVEGPEGHYGPGSTPIAEEALRRQNYAETNGPGARMIRNPHGGARSFTP